MSPDAVDIIEAVEIVTFKLVRGVSFADFVEANSAVDTWLLLQPGFRSRRIGQQHGHRIVDMLVWDSEADAHAAMRKLMEDLHDSPVHAMIDQASVTWTVSTVRHKHGCGS